MSRLTTMFSGAVSAVSRRIVSRTRRPTNQSQADPDTRADRPTAQQSSSPGQSGPNATVEVEPTSIGPVAMTYSPDPDGQPDPGEVVWTWVPYSEHDGRGKDRPVLLVAAEPAGTALGVQLTSKRHDGADFVAVGSGDWDTEHRPSWANLDRIIRVHPGGMRREATAVPHPEFTLVTQRLRQRYGWTDADR